MFRDFSPSPNSVQLDLLNDLDEITEFIGTYKERLRRARGTAKLTHVADVRRLEERLQQRRAELA
jgi:hypothetical protein